MNFKRNALFIKKSLRISIEFLKQKFIEDLCNRLNTVQSTALEETDKMKQLLYLIGAIMGITGRLNSVCERL